jgi:hypothetical protein
MASDTTCCDATDCPWRAERCPIEGCRYEVTDQDGCGLVKVIAWDEFIPRWDRGDPVVRGCLASRRSEHFVKEANR